MKSYKKVTKCELFLSFIIDKKDVGKYNERTNDNYYHFFEYILSYRYQQRGITSMTLRNGKIGETYTVNTLDLDMITMRRLEALGLTKGTSIKILNRNKSGSVIFMVRGSRLAVGKKIAESIRMKEASR